MNAAEGNAMSENVNAPEPAPAPNTGRPIWELVIEDMRERDQVGRSKYGTPLQAFNGRRAIVDAYQEALDLVVYLRQVVEEQKPTEFQCHRCRKSIRSGDMVLLKAGGEPMHTLCAASMLAERLAASERCRDHLQAELDAANAIIAEQQREDGVVAKLQAELALWRSLPSAMRECGIEAGDLPVSVGAAVGLLVVERNEAREWVRRLQSETQTLTCVYCGQAYPPGTPASGAAVLTEHIRTCAKHPMRELLAQVDTLSDLLRRVHRECGAPDCTTCMAIEQAREVLA